MLTVYQLWGMGGLYLGEGLHPLLQMSKQQLRKLNDKISWLASGRAKICAQTGWLQVLCLLVLSKRVVTRSDMWFRKIMQKINIWALLSRGERIRSKAWNSFPGEG